MCKVIVVVQNSLITAVLQSRVVSLKLVALGSYNFRVFLSQIYCLPISCADYILKSTDKAKLHLFSQVLFQKHKFYVRISQSFPHFVQEIRNTGNSGGGGFPPLFSCIDLVMHHTQDITKIRYSQKLNSFFPDMCLEILAMCYLVYSTDLQLLCKLTSLTYGTTTDI